MKTTDIRLDFCWDLDELKKADDSCINIMQWCLDHDRTNEIICKRPAWLAQRRVLQVDWIYSSAPLTRAEAYQALLETDDPMEKLFIERATQRRGPDPTLRRAAIKAHILHHYFGKKMKWTEIAERVCRCGKEHDPEQLLLCVDNLQRVERLLRHLLDACNIKLPEEPMFSLFGEVIATKGNKQRVKLETGDEIVITTKKLRKRSRSQWFSHAVVSLQPKVISNG